MFQNNWNYDRFRDLDQKDSNTDKGNSWANQSEDLSSSEGPCVLWLEYRRWHINASAWGIPLWRKTWNTRVILLLQFTECYDERCESQYQAYSLNFRQQKVMLRKLRNLDSTSHWWGTEPSFRWAVPTPEHRPCCLPRTAVRKKSEWGKATAADGLPPTTGPPFAGIDGNDAALLQAFLLSQPQHICCTVSSCVYFTPFYTGHWSKTGFYCACFYRILPERRRRKKLPDLL